jgi:hypothetical protein
MCSDGNSTGKRNDEEGADEKLFVYASHIPIPVNGFKVSFAPSSRLFPYSHSRTYLHFHFHSSLCVSDL